MPLSFFLLFFRFGSSFDLSRGAAAAFGKVAIGTGDAALPEGLLDLSGVRLLSTGDDLLGSDSGLTFLPALRERSRRRRWPFSSRGEWGERGGLGLLGERRGEPFRGERRRSPDLGERRARCRFLSPPRDMDLRAAVSRKRPGGDGSIAA